MTIRARRSGSEAGFSLIELLVVVSILLIITAIAIGQYIGARTQRVRHEATASLPALKAFEEAYWERTGAFVFSADAASDRIKYATATTNACEGPVLGGTLQNAANPASQKGFKPQGCQFQYYVIPDRCEANCSDTGANDACQGGTPVRCFCAIAIGSGSVAKNEKFCIDDLGQQFASVAGMKDWN